VTRAADDQKPKLGIIAGGGSLPILLADACKSSGRFYHMVGIEGFALSADLAPYEHDWTPIGSLGHTLDILRSNDCRQVVMAGNVKRPDFKSLKMDWRATKLLPKLLNAARRGDDALLSVVVKTFEDEGLEIIGADDVLEDLLIGSGPLGAITPDSHASQDITRGLEVVRELGALDIGQATVICNQLVLAVEAVEGTDAMLDRCLEISLDLRGDPANRRGVMVKIPKPGQERRVDLPTVGISTLERASAIGLSGIAVAAGGALVLDQEKIMAFADMHNMFVFGIDMASGDPS